MSQETNLVVEDLHISYKTYLDPQIDLRQRFKGGFGSARRRHLTIEAVRGVSFTLNQGESLGIVGHNGAGKSTLLLGIAGLVESQKGRVLSRSRPTLLGVGSVLNTSLSGRRNIEIGCLAMGLDKEYIRTKMDELIDFSGLEDAIDRPLKSYSTGMRARLTFTVATVKAPEVLIIDEALTVGDAEFREKAFKRIEEIRLAAGSVILVSHNINEVKRMCDRVIWLDHGRVVRDGNSNSVLKLYNATKSNPELAEDLANNADYLIGPLQPLSASGISARDEESYRVKQLESTSLENPKTVLSSRKIPIAVELEKASEPYRSLISEMSSNEYTAKALRSPALLEDWIIDHASGALLLEQPSPGAFHEAILLRDTFSPEFLETYDHWTKDQEGALFLDKRFPATSEDLELIYCGSRHPKYHLHWWMDVATRAYQASKSFELGEKKLLVTSNLSKFQEEALIALGIEKSYIYDPVKELERIRKIHYQDLFHFGSRSAELVEDLVLEAAKAASKKALPNGPSKQGLKLYVSYREDSSREVLNEDELEKVMEEAGFQVVSLPSLSFLEIVELFSGAQVVVGVSGNALAHTIFSKEQTIVVELLPETYVSGIQAEISGKAGLDHAYLVCEAFGDGKSNKSSALYDSVHVPIDKLMSLLTEIKVK